jgi:hypothetical protein
LIDKQIFDFKENVMENKSFFRIRVKESSPYPAVMVKDLGKVTKAWQLKKGNASDYAAYSNLEVQPMIKEGNAFVPAPNAAPAAESDSSGTGGSSSNSPAPAPQADETVTESEPALSSYNFSEMSVEQLKAYLSEKGVAASEIRGLVKADLIARAESLTESEND